MHKDTNILQTHAHVEVHNLTFFSLCAEARALVISLLQPDPTVRLTAEQTLVHQWVKTMTSLLAGLKVRSHSSAHSTAL